MYIRVAFWCSWNPGQVGRARARLAHTATRATRLSSHSDGRRCMCFRSVFAPQLQGHAGALKKCQNPMWPSYAFSDSPLSVVKRACANFICAPLGRREWGAGLLARGRCVNFQEIGHFGTQNPNFFPQEISSLTSLQLRTRLWLKRGVRAYPCVGCASRKKVI